MPWSDPLTGASLIRWFENAASGSAVGERKLDFFATSMRDFDDVAPQLDDLLEQKPPTATDPTQRRTDLRAAGLAVAGPDWGLTPLGTAVRAQWHAHGVADSEPNHELARHILLVLEAIRLSVPQYLEVIRYWSDLSAHFNADELLENWDKLYAINYFDFERVGIVPGALIRAAKVALSDIDLNFGDMAKAQPAKTTASVDGAEKIERAVRGKVPRGRHRATFCLAMELCKSDLDRCSILLSKFGYPEQPRAWTVLPEAARALCRDILRAAGKSLSLAELEPIAAPVLDLLQERKNVILFGPPGTGKTRAAMATADVWRSRHGLDSVFEVTFHPSYSYEDFVWGFRPNEKGEFSPTPGILLAACESANEKPTLLLIDEVNRADTAKVFGELITYIEPDKRNRSFRLAQDPKADYRIPSNLFFLGTMNTADRSVSLLDIALRRRFAFVEYAPSATAFDDPSWMNSISGVLISRVMQAINERLARTGIEPDRAIGHALLHVPVSSPDPVATLIKRFHFDVYPLVVDYCFTDRAKVHEILQPLVGSDGRLLDLTPSDFALALTKMIEPGSEVEAS